MSNLYDFKARSTSDTGGTRTTVVARNIKTTDGGGGGGMDDILRRLERVEKELSEKPSKSDLENSELKIKLELKDQTSELKEAIQNSIRDIPKEDKIKSIIDEKSKGLDLATNTYVREQVHKSNSALFKWIIGIAVSIALVFIRQLFS
ncbi:hypothetical protein [Paenibacillus sp. FSL L8-0708]|uniref:hypothetical protein n=1 Tax=Paenibacillus sp. FSL L8-0708 TaxID=2975311 RepID=UPI0030F53A08